MALTATATVKLRKEVADIIGLRNEVIVSISPDKPNIVYVVKEFVSVSQTFSPLVEAIINNGLLKQ